MLKLKKIYTSLYKSLIKLPQNPQHPKRPKLASTKTCGQHNVHRNHCPPFPPKTEKEKTIGTHLHNLLQNVWESFTEMLQKKNQTEKCVKLITALSNGCLKSSNLVWKCALDMGKLSMCTTTTNMHYNKDCVEFFSLFNLMFGSSAINVLRGTAHFGTLVNVTNQRGLYDPTEGNYNFPIPSINTLRKVSCGYPSNIGIGLIEHSLDMAQEKAENGDQFVISFDGKMVAQGCKNECNGDVNLWGREKPNLDGTINKLC